MAERIQAARLDGIWYRSAMTPGGTVLFDPSIVTIGGSRLVQIVETKVEYR